MYIFFDTETTGLPKNYKAPMTDIENWPRIIQLAFQVYNENKELIFQYESLVKPDGWVIPDGKFWIENGFTQEKQEKEGVPISEVLDVFIKYHDMCDYLIAHNIGYDYNVLGAEFIRASKRCQRRGDNKLKHLCTKELSTKYCQIPPFRYGTYKWPNLTELHQKLFNCNFSGAHQADDDVAATAKCFFELVDREVITL